MDYAPIALFIYKRPEHTRRTLESLMQCPEFTESPLYVFCDGAKYPADQALVDQARGVVRSLVGAKAKMIESETNRGLANSIISGVNQLLHDSDRVIVLEDDLLVHPCFLTYMNAALETYQDERSVMHVSGYMFPCQEIRYRNEVIFLPFTTSWGWGTWRRAWQQFDPKATGWEILQFDRNLRVRFNLDGSYEYFEMLKSQMSGAIDSWAIRWYWSVFQQKGCTVFPPISYVSNIGFDGSGTHTRSRGSWLFKPQQNLEPPVLVNFPTQTAIDTTSYQIVKALLHRSNRYGLPKLRKIKNSFVALFK